MPTVDDKMRGNRLRLLMYVLRREGIVSECQVREED